MHRKSKTFQFVKRMYNSIFFFLSFKMFVYQNLLGVVLNGHCCVYQGYWKETWCRNENSHWIDCSSWYLLVWNLERLQLQSTENDCPLFYQTEFLKYCVWWCKGGKKDPTVMINWNFYTDVPEIWNQNLQNGCVPSSCITVDD